MIFWLPFLDFISLFFQGVILLLHKCYEAINSFFRSNKGPDILGKLRRHWEEFSVIRHNVPLSSIKKIITISSKDTLLL